MVYINSLIKKIYHKIKIYDDIIIARHVGPDPDAVASQIALREVIKATFPKKTVLAIGKSVSRFKYLGELDKLEDIDLSKSLLIVLDVPNLSRIDGIDYTQVSEIIKIDHHPYEDAMGKVELVDPTASSTCQIIMELIFKTKLKMTKKAAEDLFLGAISDNDRFLLSYTTVKTFELITKLIKENNLNFIELYPLLYERPLNEIKFHGYLSQNLIVTDNGLGYIKINNEIIKEFNVDSATASNMINDFNFIKEVYVWIFITFDESNKIYKINMRSRGPIINEIASKYGGGGHPFASGIRIKEVEEIDKLIKDLDEACKEYKK